MSTIALPSPGDIAVVPAEQLPAIIAALASLQATAAMQLMTSTSPPRPHPSQAGESPTLDTKGAAVLLGISPTALRRLVARGEVPTMRFGRRLCFRRETLEALRASRERVVEVGR